MAKMKICFDSIEPMVLKFVCSQLFHETDASTLLLLVKQQACAFLGNCAQRQVELVMTITAQGVKDLASGALRMNADQGSEDLNVSED